MKSFDKGSKSRKGAQKLRWVEHNILESHFIVANEEGFSAGKKIKGSNSEEKDAWECFGVGKLSDKVCRNLTGWKQDD